MKHAAVKLTETIEIEHNVSDYKMNRVLLNHEEQELQHQKKLEEHLLRQRLQQMKVANKSAMTVEEKVNYEKALYAIRYDLNKMNGMVTLPMSVTVIAIILLMLLL